MNGNAALSGEPVPERIIVLDASPAGESVGARVAALQGNDLALLASARQPGHEGIGALPVMLETCLNEAGWDAPDLIVVVIGPGSFTGLRTTCALGAGLAFGAGCPVVGVTRGEALAPFLDQLVATTGLEGWLCIYGARRGRWFVEVAAAGADVPGDIFAVQSGVWQPGPGIRVLAGDAAAEAADVFGDERCRVSPVCEADFKSIALAGLRRLRGDMPPRSPLPLYVDPPEAKLPRSGLRATPQ